MGFYDAFNQERNWWATSYLAIDQGPIIIMIENYRTQLLWNLFMSNPEIQPMMDAIGFYSAPDAVEPKVGKPDPEAWPNPCKADGILNFKLNQTGRFNVEILSLDGKKQATIYAEVLVQEANHRIELSEYKLLPGIYILSFSSEDKQKEYFKLILQ